MASESSSSTPPALTPDVTGSGDSSSTAEGTARKTRRQTAFYPNMNSSNKPIKPFSRSAAKRQSVMTLGSIEHLQHYFTKTGIAAKSNPSKKLNSLLVPAIGGVSSMKTAKASLGSVHEFELPPSPIVPEIRQPAFPSFVKTYETDPEAFLPGVIGDLIAVTEIWGIESGRRDGDGSPSRGQNSSGLPSSLQSAEFDVLNALKTTTRVIRSVRNYVIALPDESAGTLRTQYRNKIASSSPVPKRNATQSKSQADPLSLIRKSALEVLAALRELEERSRIPLSDDAYDAQSDLASSQEQTPHSRGASPSMVSDDDPDLQHVDPDMSISFVRVEGRYDSVPVWEDDNDYDPYNMSEEEREKREHWDDRLVLGGGWLYKQDVRLKDLEKEQGVVRRYVDLVDDVLFGGIKDRKRGWERTQQRVAKKEREGRGKGRRVSAGDVDVFRFPAESPQPGRRVVSSSEALHAMQNMTLSGESREMEMLSEEESIDEDDLPEWAKRSLFADNPIGRARALLHSLLPDDLQPLLASDKDKADFLRTLSSGQLLCTAYNTGVRRSRKPWGYISSDSIHDIVSLEQSSNQSEDEKGKTGWTFRRTDNLRLWAAALKLRYLLPLVVPAAPGRPDHIPSTSSPARGASPARHSFNQPSTTPNSTPAKIRFATSEPPLTFDPRLVARRDDGWDVMLESTLLRWVSAVVEETRGER